MFIKTKNGYLNTQHIVRLYVLKLIGMQHGLYAETSDGKEYVLTEDLFSREDAEDEAEHIIRCINLGLGDVGWQK